MSNTGRYDNRNRRVEPSAAPQERPETPENLVVGRNAVREVLRAGRDIEKLLVARGEQNGSMRELLNLAKENNVIVREVDRRKLDELAPNHQGIAALVSM